MEGSTVFCFTEFEFFPNFRAYIVHDLGGGGGSLFKIASRSGNVPHQDPDKWDQLQMKDDAETVRIEGSPCQFAQLSLFPIKELAEYKGATLAQDFDYETEFEQRRFDLGFCLFSTLHHWLVTIFQNLFDNVCLREQVLDESGLINYWLMNVGDVRIIELGGKPGRFDANLIRDIGVSGMDSFDRMDLHHKLPQLCSTASFYGGGGSSGLVLSIERINARTLS
ncbi:hypothetical protein Tco_1304258 [Tanacetum coccineum]